MHSFQEWLLSEMPITNFQLLGKWGPEDRKYGYTDKDIGILSSEKAREKIIRSWSLANLAQSIGTMKSARERRLRNIYEFPHEILAQWLTSKIKFNPIPPMVYGSNKKAWGHSVGYSAYKKRNLEDSYQWDPEYLAEKYENMLYDAFHTLLNKVFVM